MLLCALCSYRLPSSIELVVWLSPNPQPHPSPNPDQVRRLDYTADPDVELVKMRPEIEARLLEVKAIVKQMRSEKKFDDGALLRSLGGWVEDKSGNRDFAFFQTLPKAGPEPKILLQGLCSLYELSLADGTATKSGAFVKSLGSTLGMDFLFCNINDVCHRKGENGVVVEP